MILYWIIFILIIICANKDWKKTVLAWFSIQLLFNDCVCLKYDSPAVSLVLAVDIYLLCSYFFRKRSNCYEGSFLFKDIMIVYLISYFLSMITSSIPIGVVATGTIKYFTIGFLYLFILQKALKTNEDIKFLVRTSTVVIFLIVGVSIIEFIADNNPVLNYVYENAPIESIKGKMYYKPPYLTDSGHLQARYGLVRAYSFFGIHLDFGCTCVILLFLFGFILKKTKLHIPKIHVILLLLISGIFFSNSKTPILGLFFFVLALFDLKTLLNFKVVLLLVASIVILYISLPNIFYNIIALFDSSVSKEGEGSTVEMRARQFEIGLMMFEQNPIFGNGVGALSHLFTSSKYDDILGSESSWLKILPERGIIGVLAYFYLYIRLYKKIILHFSKKIVFLFLAGILAMETATGFMSLPLYGGVILVMIRYAQLNIININKEQ